MKIPFLVALLAVPLAASPDTATALRENPLKSRADLARAMKDLYEPLRAFETPDGFRLGEWGAFYKESTANAEAFLRPLWGLAPFAAGGDDFAHWESWRRGLARGVDPKSPGFWGPVEGKDQKAVEMAPITLALMIAPKRIWDPLSPKERSNLVAWLRSIERCPDMNNNWVFFRILVHQAFLVIGEPIDARQHAEDLAKVDSFYVKDGWYGDGAKSARDYYVPMAMHFYGLIYAMTAVKQDPERCARFRERAALFADDFQHWFTPAGDALPYGRSLTYRFAQSAFWSALLWADVRPKTLSRGQVKGLWLRNLRWWMKQPIFDHAGLLTVGYRYPNELMAESYNAPGSPYWALKSFLALAIPANDAFWSLPEEPLPARAPMAAQPYAGMILQHDDALSHTTALASGQMPGFMALPGGAKYGKFAYSTAFGFCALGTEGGIGGGGFDSTLTLSEDDFHYRSRETITSVVVGKDFLASRWKPWTDVTVESWVAPAGDGHVRIHHVVTARKLTVADTGYSLPNPSLEFEVRTNSRGISVKAPFGWSALADLAGGATFDSTASRANLNLLHPRVRFPFAKRSLAPGEHWIATAFVGVPDEGASKRVDAFFAGLAFDAKGVPSIRRGNEAILVAVPIEDGLRLPGAKP